MRIIGLDIRRAFAAGGNRPNDPSTESRMTPKGRELAGDTTSTDPRSRRIRDSPKGRPCHERGLLSPLSIGGLPAPSCSRRAPVPRMGSPYRRPLSETGGQQGAKGSHTG